MDDKLRGKIIFNSNTSVPADEQATLPNIDTDDKINPGKETKRFNHLVSFSQQPLMKLKSTFPFQLVPDELIIDVNRVSYFNKTLFSKEVTALEIKDITEVIVTNDPFFATMVIESRVLVEQNIKITHLSKSEARKAQAILHGMISCLKQRIDYQEIPIDELASKLELIGRPNIDKAPLAQTA